MVLFSVIIIEWKVFVWTALAICQNGSIIILTRYIFVWLCLLFLLLLPFEFLSFFYTLTRFWHIKSDKTQCGPHTDRPDQSCGLLVVSRTNNNTASWSVDESKRLVRTLRGRCKISDSYASRRLKFIRGDEQ